MTWQQWSGMTTLSERKLGFHSTQRNYVVKKKKAHNTRRTLLYSACDSAWLRLQLSRATAAPQLHTATASTPPLRSKKKTKSVHKPTSQPACKANHENQSTFCMRDGSTWPTFCRPIRDGPFFTPEILCIKNKTIQC